MNASGRSAVGWVLLGLVAGGCGGNEVQDEAAVASGSSGGPTSGASASRGVAFVGFDASPPLVEALAEGTLHGVVVQNPYKMGDVAVRVLVDHLEGRPVEASIPTGETMVTPQNMNDPEIRPLLQAPKLEHSVDANPSGKKAKKYRIMVIPKGTSHEHWKSIHAGAARAAADLGTVEIIWKGPQKEDERTEQISLVQTAAQTQVDGIVLAPMDAEALVPPVEEAVAKGIPVVIIDSALRSQKPISYVATDNYHGGVLAADRLAEVLGGKGKIILMRYMVGSASTEEREKGFTDTIAKYPEITYVSDDQYAGATTDTAQKTAQSLVARFRGRFDGVFCPNESSTSGMLRALREAGLLAPRK
jgi:ribose transport system substrate-binding protein